MSMDPLGQNVSGLIAQARAQGGPSVTPGSVKNIEQARKTAQDFEAFFLSQMFQHMFSGIQTDEMFGGGQGEEMWRSMLVDQYGKDIASNGGIGIADQVMKALLQTQEVDQ
ncbi:rod-binding protein [Caenispirillum salinarum]|uniref:rod-binding protein n=1 Tax=Caenispirillum salinarum TaxID=859058 RepID=UPI00384A4B2C